MHPEPGAPNDARLVAWIEREIGGTVTRIEPLRRWRPAWDVDVQRDDGVLALHVRGERETRQAMPYWIADEKRTHDLLEAHGVPVPHVYGYCDDPYAIVMDRLSGFVDLSFADDDDERTRLIDSYLSLLPRIYNIPLDEVGRLGFTVPTTAEQIALDLFVRFEHAYDERMARRDPVCEFLRGWLHRNHPRHRTRACFITYDAFQFMYEHGRITGLIDFELAHVGDPLTEVAALRVRDTIKNLGDLAAIAGAWSTTTSEELDHDVIVFHTIAYNANTVLSAAPLIEAPNDDGDLMSHYGWYVNSARWAFEDIADLMGIELAPVDVPVPSPTRHGATFGHLLAGLGNRGPQLQIADHERAKLFRVARHLRLVDQIGEQLQQSDLDDAAALLGARPAASELDARLVEYIAADDGAHDGELVRLLDRRVQRLHLLLGPAGSMMLRHPRLRRVNAAHASRTFGAADDLPWTPGLIAGTR